VSYQQNDYFYRKAKKENFAARSVYKLQEMDSRFRILSPGIQVLDLGAAPGSWSQYSSGKIGSSGKIIAVDCSEFDLGLPNVVSICQNVHQLEIANLIKDHSLKSKFDVVLSDMAPKTSGIKSADQERSYELCSKALELAESCLAQNGRFICKLFHGERFEKLRKKMQRSFKKVKTVRPMGTRKASKEIYFIGLGFRSLID